MKHRKEIDGLRSLAVVPVILNHAKFSMFPGGFVGVDIFFVISGFLISDIVFREVSAGKFSIISFYERRARRIFPALALVISLSFLAAFFTMLPEDFDNFSQSVIATLWFSNNILLTITSGYWDMNSDFKPLLHTWSLGVEEQFYLFYPIILLIINKYCKKYFIHFLFFGIFASAIASVVLTPIYPNGSFYLIHTRACELFIGALAAYYNGKIIVSHRVQAILSSIGMVITIVPIFLFSDKMIFPSYNAIIPCIGTALVLMFATSGTISNRILSSRPLVFIGVISYSLYLWHQPVFAFARITSITPPSPWLMGGLAVALVPVSYLSWRYVEQPFRDRQRISRNQSFGFAIGASALLGAAALGVYLAAGIPERVPGIGLGHGRYIAYNERAFDFKSDAFVTRKPHLLVVGNSTGRDLVNMMLESGRFSPFEIVYRDDVNVCLQDVMAQAHSDLIAKADAIILAASFHPEASCQTVRDDLPPLRDKPFVLVGPKHFGYNLNAYISVPRQDRPGVRASLIQETRDTNALYRGMVTGDHYVDLLQQTERRYNGVPVFNDKGEILSADRVHVTRAGARLFAQFLFDDPAWRPVFALTKPGKVR